MDLESACSKEKVLEDWSQHHGCADAAAVGPTLGLRVVHISVDVL